MLPNFRTISLSSWNYRTVLARSTEKNKWMAIPITCGVPCIVSYNKILFPFLEPDESATSKFVSRLDSVFVPLRALLNRSGTPDLVLEAELYWPTLDSKITLPQCIKTLFVTQLDDFSRKILHKACLNLIDALPTASKVHKKNHTNITSATSIESRSRVLWYLMFGKRRFENIYCGHYHHASFHENSSILFNKLTRGIVGPKQSVGIIFNALRFVKLPSTFIPKRPLFQYSPRLIHEVSTITSFLSPYHVKCCTEQGVNFDVLRLRTGGDEPTIGEKLSVLHFGYCGIDGSPYQAMENYEP